MREQAAKHQTFQYNNNDSFVIINHTQNVIKAGGHTELLHHWHKELEITYVIEGHSQFHIEGEHIQAEPGQLIIINSESVHSIVPDFSYDGGDRIGAVTLLLHEQFLQLYFPVYETFYFTNKKGKAHPEIRDLMLKISDYGKREDHSEIERIYIKGLIFQLFSAAYEQGHIDRNVAVTTSQAKKSEQLKAILQYMETHYREPITQAEMAHRFFFTQQSFSRFFKQNTGMTFTDYLLRYRVQEARKELVSNDQSIAEIAHKHGFSDERNFIRYFKKLYFVTPFQYRKKLLKNREIT